jgi:hypothetical protein
MVLTGSGARPREAGLIGAACCACYMDVAIDQNLESTSLSWPILVIIESLSRRPLDLWYSYWELDIGI